MEMKLLSIQNDIEQVKKNKRILAILKHDMRVDYLGIYQVNFDTGECQIFRNSERMGTGYGVNFEEGYQIGRAHV